MRFGRSINGASATNSARFIRRRLGFTRHRQAHEVGWGATAAESSRHALASDRFGQPADNQMLERGRRRAGAPGGDILVEHAGKQIAERTDRFAGSEDISKEAGVLSAGVRGHGRQIGEGGLALRIFRPILREEFFRLGAGGGGKDRARVQGFQMPGAEFDDVGGEGAEFGGRKRKAGHGERIVRVMMGSGEWAPF